MAMKEPEVEITEGTLRVRRYPDAPGEQWVVFFRPKSKPLNAMRISEDLWKNYPGVTNVTKIHRNKLQVTVNNPKEANSIVGDPRFSIEYRVWIPARLVEIDGVITEEHLTSQKILEGIGVFKQRNLPSVKILEVRQLRTTEGVGKGKKFIPSNSYRVTFEGSALPDFLQIDGLLRLPVRMYVPKLMICTNCQKLGHTKAYCSNKTICAKCGGKHEDALCQKVQERCLLCGGTAHEPRSCPKYLERSDKLKKELKKRSKRSFADIVNSAATTTKNTYALLSEEMPTVEEESTEEAFIFNRKGGAPKRKRNPENQTSNTQIGNSDKNQEALPKPGLADFKRVFPPVAKLAPKVPTKSDAVLQQKTPSVDHRLPFSTILQMVLSILSGPTRALFEPLLPFIKGIGKHLGEKSPLTAFISFDD